MFAFENDLIILDKKKKKFKKTQKKIKKKSIKIQKNGQTRLRRRRQRIPSHPIPQNRRRSSPLLDSINNSSLHQQVPTQIQ